MLSFHVAQYFVVQRLGYDPWHPSLVVRASEAAVRECQRRGLTLQDSRDFLCVGLVYLLVRLVDMPPCTPSVCSQASDAIKFCQASGTLAATVPGCSKSCCRSP